MSLLENIDSPVDLKKLSLEQLPRLAQEIRQEIITTVSKTGGHLASSLGAVEIAIALHYCLDTPKDKIVWDVGHQAYAHKILTGRRKRLNTLRQWEGLSGFPSRDESIYDPFTVGHGSTSISTALGLACADSAQRSKIVAVIGDASLGGGMALEALNHAGQLKKDIVVILNDNKMGISRSVGALSHYLNRIITMPIYNRIRQDIENLVRRVPRLGKRLYSTAKRLEESLKNLLVPGIIFEELGFRYFGPIDGHNVREIVHTLRNVLKLEGPVLVHAVTVKGKGYSRAEKIPEKFHGISSNAQDRPKNKHKTFTQVFSEELIQLARQDARIVAITAAMPEGTGLDKFAQVFPQRFYDVGMAEAHAVGFAAGLASRGLRPCVAIYSTFLQRSYDQLIHDIGLQNVPVVLALDRAGIVGEDGPTHQGIFDLAYLRHIPNLTVMAPKDAEELKAMLEFSLQASGPSAIRFPKGEVSEEKGLFSQDLHSCPVEHGRGEILRQGKHLAIIAVGSMVYPSLKAAGELASQGIECAVANARFVKPFDEALIKELCSQFKLIVVAEEGICAGGFGAAILEFLEKERISGIQLKRVSLPCAFIPHGKREFLLERYGLTAQGLIQTVLKELSHGKVSKSYFPWQNKDRSPKV